MLLKKKYKEKLRIATKKDGVGQLQINKYEVTYSTESSPYTPDKNYFEYDAFNKQHQEFFSQEIDSELNRGGHNYCQ